ncbi:MAG: ATP-binding cassette domain-containing protein [Ilumatobacteraceae bacterium]
MSEMMASPPTVAAAVGVIDARKTYGVGDATVNALDGVDVRFEPGKFTAIMGPSGSGKSTLLHCLAGLDSLSSGAAFIGETYLADLSDKELTELRRSQVGFVFQSFNLIPTLTARENIVPPLALGGQEGDAVWIDRVIDTVGLRDRLSHRRASCPAVSNSASRSRKPWRPGRRSSRRRADGQPRLEQRHRDPAVHA